MLGPNTLPQRRLINIHQVVERVRTLAAAEAPPGVKLIRDYDPSIPDFKADPDQLIQAVLNIVRNALQAVGQKGEILLRTRSLRRATIGHHRHKLAVRIEIIDNGPGIPPEMMENIFFPMVTGRPDGTGLGLPIAQDLVNQHHGLIECSSEPGKTVFTLLLPIETHHEQS
jgi:two-component system nitrogen regulation sensor histidine kinase GlnL